MNTNLLAPVSEAEIYKALHQVGFLKAPGPNGIHALFYHTYWYALKSSITDLVLDFFNNHSPLHLINHTNIALIPKTESPESVSHFRPISLCKC